MIDKLLGQYKLVLASKSPRRQQLLKELGFSFEVRITKEADESFSDDIKKETIAEYLAVKKTYPYLKDLSKTEILVTADTIVLLDEEVLNKPQSEEEAKEMIKKLSGKSHKVITGVCLSNNKIKRSFSSKTTVFFKELTDEEISYYVSEYKPYDKAGAYGIQEWIGYIGINKIDGSYFNVMGLPVQKLYEELQLFLKDLK